MFICVSSLVGCQTALQSAVKENDARAVKRELKAGASPYESAAAANLLWQLPVFPLALAGDVTRLAVNIGTLGIYGAIEDAITGNPRDEVSTLMGAVCSYGSDNAYEMAWEKKNPVVLFAFLASGKVNEQALKDWCLHHALSIRDDKAFAYCMAKGANPNGVVDDKTPLMIAIQTGNEEAARHLIGAGADINRLTKNYSCQFVAQEANQLSLYQSLGGVMVAQPLAPPIDCDMCVDGVVGWQMVNCSKCGGDGWIPSYDSGTYQETDVFGRPRTYYSGTKMDAGRNCFSCKAGKVRVPIKCTKCGGVGSISRYAQ